MAAIGNHLFDLGRQGFLDGSIDFDTDVIKVLLVRTADGGGTYAPNLATNQYVGDITAADRVQANSAALAGKTVTGGVANANDIVFTAVPAGKTGNGLAIYKQVGGDDSTPADDRLIGWIDTCTGLPVTPNGGDINVAWSEAAEKIFKL